MNIILFDMMSTLVEEPYPSTLEKFWKNKMSRELFFQLKNREAAHEYERGKISEAEFFQKFYKENHEGMLKPIKVKKILFQNIRYLVGVKEILLDLQKNKNIKTGVASNYSEWYEIILKELRDIQKCDYLFFSCEMGLRKPEIEYYKMIQDSLEQREGKVKIYFIDDREINLKPAISLGWKTHLMKNTYDLKKFLKDFLPSN